MRFCLTVNEKYLIVVMIFCLNSGLDEAKWLAVLTVDTNSVTVLSTIPASPNAVYIGSEGQQVEQC